MPTDRATIFFVTERLGDDNLPLRGIYLTDIWHGQGLHRRAIKELHSDVAKACWLKGPQLVRVMIQRLLHALANQNENVDCELGTSDTNEEWTDYPVLVIDFTSGDVRLIHGSFADSQTAKPIASQPFDKADKLDCGKPDEDE